MAYARAKRFASDDRIEKNNPLFLKKVAYKNGISVLLSGFAFKNRRFGFHVFFFSTSDDIWSTTGFCDLKNLPRSFSKHKKNNIFIHSQISLKTFETSRISLASKEKQRLNISLHNSKVKENPEILKLLINGSCFLAL